MNAAKSKIAQERGKFYQQAEDLLGRDVPAILSITTFVRTGEAVGGGFTPDKLGYYYTKDMYIKNTKTIAGYYAGKMANMLSIQPIKRNLAIFKANECACSLQPAVRCL